VVHEVRAWIGVVLLVGCSSGAPVASPRPPPPAAEPAAQLSALPRSPKPGERVRQPELDGYCDSRERSQAFYYHGGNPVVRIARKDQCLPLYITDCEAEGRCYAPRDQEPGMWCCAPRQGEQPAIHAAR